MARIEPATVLNDRYELGEELGRGGMGVVHRAHDTLLDRPVAIKLLTEAQLETLGRSSMLNEAQAIAKLKHPNIVAVYDAGEIEGVPYIVMELVEGISLNDTKPEGFEAIIKVSRQVCQALDHAHSHGIVHRDLKPENVLLERDGTAKLVDFGIARPVASRLTSEGDIIGTVFYLAPEAAQGREIGEKVDLYALGVMLYELTTGALPFQHGDPLQVISQHLNASVVPPRAKNPEIPPLLESLILQLMSKVPDERPSSAREVLERLSDEDILWLQVEAEREFRVLDRIARGRFVGRGRELALAKSLWNRTLRGEGKTLLITGEAGVGKTRLTRELATYAEVTGGRVMLGASYAEGGSPYAPLQQLLRAVLVPDGDDIPQIPDGLLGDLLKLAPDLQPHYPVVSLRRPLDPEAEQQRLFESMVEFLGLLSERSPVMLVLEDAQWADSGSLALLRHLARRTRNIRLLLLANYREVEPDGAGLFHEVLHDLDRERLAQHINLDRFDLEATQDLLSAVLEGPLTPQFLDGIYKQTEGNPFFIEEVCKHLVEEGKLYYEEGEWHCPSIDSLEIPRSVRVAVRSRVARLSVDAQEVLQIAAILGREFDFQTLQQASQASEEPLIGALDEAMQAQLISETGENGVVQFAFVHGLMASSLAEEIPALRRRKLHKQAADAIETLRPEDYEDLAHHYLEAGERAQAYRYFTRAAGRAAQAYATQEALTYFQAALELEADVPDLHPASRAAVFGDLAEVLAGVNRYDEALAELEHGITVASAGEPNETDLLICAELLQKKGEVLRSKGLYAQATEAIERGLGSVPAGHPGEEGALKIALASVLAREGRLAEAQRWCEEGMEDVEASGNLPELAHAYSLLGTIRRDLGDTKASMSHRQKSLEISEGLDDIPLQIEAHNNLAVAHYDLGRMDEAIAHYEKSRELSEEVGNLNTMARAQINLGEVQLIRGNPGSAQRSFEEALDIWHRTGYRLGQAYGSADMGAVLILQGKPEQALDHLAESQRIFEDLEARTFLPMAFRLRAEAQLALGDLHQAEEFASRALALTEELSSIQEEGATLRVLGLICHARGADDLAEEHLQRSVKIFREAEIQFEEGLSLYELAQLWYDAAHFRRAQTPLERAKELFARVGAAHAFDLARSLEQKITSQLHGFPEDSKF